MTQVVQVGTPPTIHPSNIHTVNACTACVNAGTVRRERLMDREYVVFPVVPIVPGVLNGMLCSANEVERSVPGWNGRPLTLRHPKMGGVPVSANEPSVWQSFWIGWLFNARWVDGRMVAEGWIDEAAITALGAANVATGLLEGKHTEVSTGYFCDIEPSKGVHNGERYSGVQAGLVPDHLAILPDERGACDWDDGCGIPRVNRRSKMDEVTEVVGVVENDEAAAAVQADVEEAGVVEEVATGLVLPAELSELLGLLSEFGGVGGLRQTLTGMQNALMQRRTASVNRVVTLSANSLTAGDLENVDDALLAKLEQAFRPADYSGRAVAQNTATEQWVPLAPVSKKGE